MVYWSKFQITSDGRQKNFIDSYMHRKWYILSKPNFKLTSKTKNFHKKY